LAGLQSIPIELTEAATVDGASYLQNLWHIKLPYLAGVIGITAILRLIDAFRGLEVIFNLTYGGPGVSTEVLSLHLYKAAFVNQRLGVASAIAVVLMALILALSAVLISNTTRVEKKRG
jgi:multiple sugar transport system permease protein